MTTIEINDVVIVKYDVETEPLHMVYQGTIAKVIDKTVPNYYLIRHKDGADWIDGKFIELAFQ